MAARKTSIKAKAPPKKVGAPAHQPTEETRLIVSELRAAGCTHVYIASRIGLKDKDTLVKHYGAELEHAKEHAVANMASALYRKGINGDTACMIFWLKTQARWAEAKDKTGDDSADAAQPVKVVLNVVDASVPRA